MVDRPDEGRHRHLRRRPLLAILTLVSSLVCAFFLNIPDLTAAAEDGPAFAPAR
jgi:hypothetical protein